MIDDIDKKILYEIDAYPLVSENELAAICGVEIKEISSRVRSLFSNGTIRYSMPIVNLDRLGFSIFIFEVILDRTIQDEALEPIKALKNIAWLATSVDRKILLGAIFAETPIRATEVSSLMKESLVGNDKVRLDVSLVAEKYVLGQRYLLDDHRRTDIRFDNSRVAYEGSEVRTLNREERGVLENVRELKETSLSHSASLMGRTTRNVESIIRQLGQDQVIVKFQPVFDHSKLGVLWHHISLKVDTFSPTFPALVDELHSLTRVVHINRTLGSWDLNFELHCESQEDVQSIWEDIEQQFGAIVFDKRIIEVGFEHKFNFLVDAVLEAAQ